MEVYFLKANLCLETLLARTVPNTLISKVDQKWGKKFYWRKGGPGFGEARGLVQKVVSSNPDPSRENLIIKHGQKNENG